MSHLSRHHLKGGLIEQRRSPNSNTGDDHPMNRSSEEDQEEENTLSSSFTKYFESTRMRHERDMFEWCISCIREMRVLIDNMQLDLMVLHDLIDLRDLPLLRRLLKSIERMNTYCYREISTSTWVKGESPSVTRVHRDRFSVSGRYHRALDSPPISHRCLNQRYLSTTYQSNNNNNDNNHTHSLVMESLRKKEQGESSIREKEEDMDQFLFHFDSIDSLEDDDDDESDSSDVVSESCKREEGMVHPFPPLPPQELYGCHPIIQKNISPSNVHHGAVIQDTFGRFWSRLESFCELCLRLLLCVQYLVRVDSVSCAFFIREWKQPLGDLRIKLLKTIKRFESAVFSAPEVNLVHQPIGKYSLDMIHSCQFPGVVFWGPCTKSDQDSSAQGKGHPKQRSVVPWVVGRLMDHDGLSLVEEG